MALSLIIPDEVVWAIKLPKKQMEGELIKEIAFSLYDRGLTSIGIARRFGNLSRIHRGLGTTWYFKTLL